MTKTVLLQLGLQLWVQSDGAWALIDLQLPRGKPGKPRVDDRSVISGIQHVLKTGCHWRDMPPEYGPATTIYNRYNVIISTCGAGLYSS